MQLSSLKRVFLCVTMALLAASCGTTAQRNTAVGEKPVNALSFRDLPGWDNDRHDLALMAFQKSCNAANKRVGEGKIPQNLCFIAQQTDPSRAKAFFEENFYPVAQASGERVHYTAYYEPELEGSYTYGYPYVYPLYNRPAELKDGQPYYTRAQINAGALNGRGLELLYLKDPVDLFFLHIQGSGRVRLPDGRVTRVGFAGKNWHPYRSVGQEMVARGFARSGQASADYIKKFMRDNPVQGQSLLEHNTSYIFFREVAGLAPQDGPIGALGVPLMPLRSVAVDPAHVSLGWPVWVGLQDENQIFPRLMIAQDVGSAIKGKQRGDLFFGAGDAAGQAAGRINTSGTFVVLQPRLGNVRVSQNAF
jgi:membrane-bound lytic murein transglycosylase A